LRADPEPDRACVLEVLVAGTDKPDPDVELEACLCTSPLRPVLELLGVSRSYDGNRCRLDGLVGCVDMAEHLFHGSPCGAGRCDIRIEDQLSRDMINGRLFGVKLLESASCCSSMGEVNCTVAKSSEIGIQRRYRPALTRYGRSAAGSYVPRPTSA
jgi:hypothetical protein